MAAPIRSAATTSKTLDRVPLVSAITSLLQQLNPQSSNFENINSAPLNQFSPHLDPKLVIKVIQKQTNPFHALFFFNWASNANPSPNYYQHSHLCFAAITEVLLSHSLLSIAISLLRNSNKLSDFFISKFIKAYGDRGNIKAAIFWFHQAKKIESGKCLFSYNSILGVLIGRNMMKSAEEFFNQMLAEHIVQPDVSTYTTMIRGFCKSGMIDNARKMFDEMLCRPNSLTYNTIINGYCKKGDMETAVSLFNRMIDENVLPDTVTYSTLIDGYCKIGELTDAKKLMSEMVEKGCKPNILTYNAMVNGLCLKGYVEEAKMMVTKMRLDGLKDNNSTHLSILKGFCIAGKSEDAIKYHRNFFELNMETDVKYYGVVINEYCKMGKPYEAISVLREMQARGIKHRVWNFNSVLRVLVETADFDRAIQLLKQMPQMGCIPSFVSYSTIICSLCMATGRMRDVDELVDVMIRSGHIIDATMYNCLVKGYSQDGNDETALRIAYEMINKKYVVSLENFSVLVKELCAKGKVTEAENLCEMCGGCPAVVLDNYKRVLDEHICSHQGIF